MAKEYVIEIKKVTVRGDMLTISGVVDTIETVASGWKSHLDSLPDAEAQMDYLCTQLCATYEQEYPANDAEEELELKGEMKFIPKRG